MIRKLKKFSSASALRSAFVLNGVLLQLKSSLMWVDFNALPGTARVWIFQSDRLLEPLEVQALQAALVTFLESWCAHAAPLRSSCKIVHRIFVIIGLDEGPQKATGCAIDSLFHSFQHWERNQGLQLTNRLLMAYRSGDTIQVASLEEFKKAIARLEITAETRVFDTTVSDKKSFETHFETRVASSWYERYLLLAQP